MESKRYYRLPRQTKENRLLQGQSQHPNQRGHQMSNTQQKINEVCDSVRDLLLEKNRKYGDSALNPSRIFAKSDAVEQIKVRIDDKLSRIATSGTSGVDEDTLQDLIGYLVLLKIATEQVPFAATYEDVLEDAAAAATAGQELLNEYGVDDVDNQELSHWEEFNRKKALARSILDAQGEYGYWEEFNWEKMLAWSREYRQWVQENSQSDNLDDDYLWDPSLGPAELSQEEVDMILRNRDISDSDPDEIVKVIEKCGFLLGVKANGNTCVLGTNGKCETATFEF
jgi:hypothetical protein